MTPNISTPDTFRPLITYPGITTECIPRTKRAYEAVFNCGGYSVAPPELQDLILRTSLEWKRTKGVKSLVYISDELILASNGFTPLRTMIDEIFPGTNSYIPVRRSAQTQNNAFNLRVVASEMDQLSLDRAFEEMPDACAIASIPYSDPAIAPLLSGRDTESLLYRSLSLLAKNDRTTPSEIAKDLNGRLDTRIGNIQDIERVFDENPMSTLVFKVIGHRAWGTSTQIVGVGQRAEFLKKAIEFPYEAYQFIEPFLVKRADGKVSPAQLRPYIVDGQLLGSCIKLAGRGRSLQEAVDEKSIFKMPSGNLASVNDQLNSSSGKSISLFFDRNGQFMSGSKGIGEVLSREDMMSFSTLDFENLSDPDLILALTMSTIPLVTDIQYKTNKLLGTLTSA